MPRHSRPELVVILAAALLTCVVRASIQPTRSAASPPFPPSTGTTAGGVSPDGWGGEGGGVVITTYPAAADPKWRVIEWACLGPEPAEGWEVYRVSAKGGVVLVTRVVDPCCRVAVDEWIDGAGYVVRGSE